MPIKRFQKAILTAFALAGLLSTGYAILPRALDVARIVFDPVALVQYELKVLPSQNYIGGIAQALDDDDPDLARGIHDLALEHGVLVPDELRQRLEEAEGLPATLVRKARCVQDAVLTDTSECIEGVAVKVVKDLTLVGDVKDLLAQPWPDYDGLTVTLASVGIASTAATVAGGAGLPARMGVTMLKMTRKAGKLSASLMADLQRLVSNAVDSRAARDFVDRIGRIDIGSPGTWQADELANAARRIVRAEAFDEIADTGANINGIREAAGIRAALDTLQTAESTADIARSAKIAAAFKERYLAVLKLTRAGGKGLYKLGKLLFSIALWLVSAAAWLLAAFWFTYRTLRALWRAVWRIRRLAGVATAAMLVAVGMAALPEALISPAVAQDFLSPDRMLSQMAQVKPEGHEPGGCLPLRTPGIAEPASAYNDYVRQRCAEAPQQPSDADGENPDSASHD